MAAIVTAAMAGNPAQSFGPFRSSHLPVRHRCSEADLTALFSSPMHPYPRCKMLCCCAGKDDNSQVAYAEVAAILSKFFHVSWAPTVPLPLKKTSNLFARWTTSASWYDHIGVLAGWTSPSLLLTRLLHRRARAAADVAAALLDLAPLLVLMLLMLMALEVLRVVGWEGPGG